MIHLGNCYVRICYDGQAIRVQTNCKVSNIYIGYLLQYLLFSDLDPNKYPNLLFVV